MPLTVIKSSQPSLSKSTNAVPHFTHGKEGKATPEAYETSVKFQSPSLRKSRSSSSEKLVT